MLYIKILNINFMKRTIVIFPASILFHKSIHRMDSFPLPSSRVFQKSVHVWSFLEVSPWDLKGHTGQQVKTSSGGAQLQTRNSWFRFIPVWEPINLRKAGKEENRLGQESVCSFPCVLLRRWIKHWNKGDKIPASSLMNLHTTFLGGLRNDVIFRQLSSSQFKTETREHCFSQTGKTLYLSAASGEVALRRGTGRREKIKGSI